MIKHKRKAFRNLGRASFPLTKPFHTLSVEAFFKRDVQFNQFLCSAFLYHDWRQQYYRIHLSIMAHNICEREASIFRGRFTMWRKVKLINLHVDLPRANIFAKWKNIRLKLNSCGKNPSWRRRRQLSDMHVFKTSAQPHWKVKLSTTTIIFKNKVQSLVKNAWRAPVVEAA